MVQYNNAIFLDMINTPFIKMNPIKSQQNKVMNSSRAGVAPGYFHVGKGQVGVITLIVVFVWVQTSEKLGEVGFAPPQKLIIFLPICKLRCGHFYSFLDFHLKFLNCFPYSFFFIFFLFLLLFLLFFFFFLKMIGDHHHPLPPPWCRCWRRVMRQPRLRL